MPTAAPATPTPTEPAPTATPEPASIATPPFFGVAMRRIIDETGLQQAQDAGVQLVRHHHVSWAALEPVRTEPPTYEWGAASTLKLEQDLEQAARANIEVMLPILFTPEWAQAVPGHRCGAIRDDRLDEFAQFLTALVERYSQPPYEVRFWELFNEPDVDPALVPPDSIFGCWGDDADENYGGTRFAGMLEQAYAAIKQADPEAQVVLGGLLLDAPEGRPTNFLRGVLEAGGGDHFDILAFHAYDFYHPELYNWSTSPLSKWVDRGGTAVGKAAFLRQMLAAYGYEKPLVLNEAGLAWGMEGEPTEAYRRAQADYVVKLHARARAIDLASVVWFGWQGPGWRYMALLNRDLSPTPAYHTYALAIRRLDGVEYVGPTDYAGIEGYRFRDDGGVLAVIWPVDGQEREVRVPADKFRRAVVCDGTAAVTRIEGDEVVIVTDRPLYLELVSQ
jgi:hypothetical protein